MKLSQIIDYLKKSIEESDLRISDKCLFENAVDIYISDRINESKSKGFPEKFTKESKEIKKDFKDEPATKDQLRALDKHKIVYDKNITKKKASELISKGMGKQ